MTSEFNIADPAHYQQAHPVKDELPDWHTHDYWRVSKNGHRPGTYEYGSETVETNEGVFYRWQLLDIHP